MFLKIYFILTAITLIYAGNIEIRAANATGILKKDNNNNINSASTGEQPQLISIVSKFMFI